MSKPPFDPSKPFETIDSGVKPKFDPSKPFEEVPSQTVAKPEQPKQNMLETASRSAMAGLTGGFQDEIVGGIYGAPKGAYDYIAGNDKTSTGLFDAISKGYTSTRDIERERAAKGFQDNPVTSMGVEAVSSIPTALAMPLTKLPALIGTGALGGYGRSESSDPGQIALETGLGAGTGLIPGVISKGSSATSSILNKLKETEALKAVGAQKSLLKHIKPEFKSGLADQVIKGGMANPLKGLEGQKQSLDKLLTASGKELETSKAGMKGITLDEVLNSIQDTAKGRNLNLKQMATEKVAIENALEDMKLLNPQTGEALVDPKTFTDYVTDMYSKARAGSNPGIVTDKPSEAIRQNLQNLTFKAGVDNKASQKYAQGKTIESFLQNKEAQTANNLLGSFGGVNAGMALGNAMTTGNPLALAQILPGIPALRSLVGKSAVTGIQGLQDLARNKQVLAVAEKLKIDPRVLVQILSQQTSNSQKGEK